jgi:hypothetical protein
MKRLSALVFATALAATSMVAATAAVGPTASGATRVAGCLDMPVSSALIQPSTCFVTGPTSDLISGSTPGDGRTGRVVSVLDQQVRKLDFAGVGRVDVSGINRNHACLHSASGQNGDLDISTMQVAPTRTASCPAGAAAGGLRPTALNHAGHSGAPLATTAASEVLASGLAASNGPPAPAASYYVWYALGSECGPGATTGCRLYVDGANEPSPATGALVVLDFGAPCFVPGSNPTIYGVQLFNTPATPGSPPQCSPDANLAPLIQAWINGYESTHGAGTPTAVLAIGSSNSLTGADPQTNFSLTTDQMNAAGQAWFNTVVKPTATALKGPAPIVAWSANDLEQAADGNWYGPGPSRAWVDGYGTAAASALLATKSCTSSDPYRLADYGDAVTKSWTTTDGGGWTDADIYYVAWGASASCAVPEVYIPTMASEWAQVSQEATQNGLPAIAFTGPMSEGGEANTLSAADSWNNLAAATGQSPPYLTVIGVLNPTVPGAPTGVAAVPGEASATVSWSAPADGGSPITGYTVSAINNTGALAQTATVTGLPPPTTATVKGLIDFTAYTFTVTATNAAGVGPASTPSSPVVPGPPLPGHRPFTLPRGLPAAASMKPCTSSCRDPAERRRSTSTPSRDTHPPFRLP